VTVAIKNKGSLSHSTSVLRVKVMKGQVWASMSGNPSRFLRVFLHCICIGLWKCGILPTGYSRGKTMLNDCRGTLQTNPYEEMSHEISANLWCLGASATDVPSVSTPRGSGPWFMHGVAQSVPTKDMERGNNNRTLGGWKFSYKSFTAVGSAMLP